MCRPTAKYLCFVRCLSFNTFILQKCIAENISISYLKPLGILLNGLVSVVISYKTASEYSTQEISLNYR